MKRKNVPVCFGCGYAALGWSMTYEKPFADR